MARFFGYFALGVALQFAVLLAHFIDNYSAGPQDWFQRSVMALYAPVDWLTGLCFANTEANLGVGFIFIPPVVLTYALVFAIIAETIRRCRGA